MTKDQALALPVLGYHGDSAPHGVAWAFEPDRPAIPGHNAASGGADSAQRIGQSCATGTNKPREAKHLTRVELEADRLPVLAEHEIFHGQNNLGPRQFRPRRTPSNVASDHQPN